jgi:hypothetical protein
MQDTMEVIQIARKGPHMNRKQKYIFCTCKENMQMDLLILKSLYLMHYTIITLTNDMQITLPTTPPIAAPQVHISLDNGSDIKWTRHILRRSANVAPMISEK